MKSMVFTPSALDAIADPVDEFFTYNDGGWIVLGAGVLVVAAIVVLVVICRKKRKKTAQNESEKEEK